MTSGSYQALLSFSFANLKETEKVGGSAVVYYKYSSKGEVE